MNTYVVSFEKNNVFQGRIVRAPSIECAEMYFKNIEPEARFIGISEDSVNYEKRGMPIDIVPEGWMK